MVTSILPRSKHRGLSCSERKWIDRIDQLELLVCPASMTYLGTRFVAANFIATQQIGAGYEPLGLFSLLECHLFERHKVLANVFAKGYPAELPLLP